MNPQAYREHNGAWTVYELIDGYLCRGTYYGYTKREAIAAFKAEHRPKR